MHRVSEAERRHAAQAGRPAEDLCSAVGDDVIAARSQHVDRHALPPGTAASGHRHWFGFQDDWILPVGAVLNAGHCAPIPDVGRGGGGSWSG